MSGFGPREGRGSKRIRRRAEVRSTRELGPLLRDSRFQLTHQLLRASLRVVWGVATRSVSKKVRCAALVPWLLGKPSQLL